MYFATAMSLRCRQVAQFYSIRWKSRFVWVSRVLAHQDVGLEEIGDGLRVVYFGPRRLGWLAEDDYRIMDVRQHGRMQYPPCHDL